MATLSIASAKGGCGKTTMAILLSAELALNHDYRVALLDSDVNQHASAFGKKADIDHADDATLFVDHGKGEKFVEHEKFARV